MRLWGRKHDGFITLGAVERAFEEERRMGSDDRREKPDASDGPKLLFWALGLVGTIAVGLGAAQFTDLKSEFRTHKVTEEQKHEGLQRDVQAIRNTLAAEAPEKAFDRRLLKAMAKKQGIKLSEIEEGK